MLDNLTIRSQDLGEIVNGVNRTLTRHHDPSEDKPNTWSLRNTVLKKLEAIGYNKIKEDLEHKLNRYHQKSEFLDTTLELMYYIGRRELRENMNIYFNHKEDKTLKLAGYQLELFNEIAKQYTILPEKASFLKIQKLFESVPKLYEIQKAIKKANSTSSEIHF
jgi:hypothetical protein